nr:hypothetical protein [Streptomyces sp. DSM 41633]
MPGAAPWERQDAPPPDDSPLDEATGSHADGVTVADLIAKVAGTGFAPTRHRLEPDDPEPEAEPEPEPAYAPAYVRPRVPDPTDVIEAVRIAPEEDEPRDFLEAEEFPEPFEDSPDHRAFDAANTDVLPALPVYEYDLPTAPPS